MYAFKLFDFHLFIMGDIVYKDLHTPHLNALSAWNTLSVIPSSETTILFCNNCYYYYRPCLDHTRSYRHQGLSATPFSAIPEDKTYERIFVYLND